MKFERQLKTLLGSIRRAETILADAVMIGRLEQEPMAEELLAMRAPLKAARDELKYISAARKKARGSNA